MKNIAIGSLFALISTASLAMDNGPRVAACDWTAKSGHSDVDVCLIVAQGQFTGGVELTALRIGNRPEMYLFENDRARIFAGSSVDTKLLWEGTVEVDDAQCRPAGKNATRFRLSNATEICLYGD